MANEPTSWAEDAARDSAKRHALALAHGVGRNDVLRPECSLCVWLVERGYGQFGGKPRVPAEEDANHV